MRAVAVPTAARQHQERKTMTAAQTESLSTEGVRSLEVRWIVRGGLTAAVAGWFSRFPAEATVLEDAYLLDPHLDGPCVRDGRAGFEDEEARDGHEGVCGGRSWARRPGRGLYPLPLLRGCHCGVPGRLWG